MSTSPDGDDATATDPSESSGTGKQNAVAEPGTATEDASGIGRWRSREVEVPMRVYKTVTVFATLIAIVSVLGGFVLIDLATDRAQRPLSEVDAVVALLGIAAIVFGAVVYAFSTRFRATGMGKPNTGAGEGDDNG